MLTTARDNHGTAGIAARPELDAMLAVSRGDLSIESLRQIAQLMIELPTPATAAEIAQHTGVARVTARRYLEYLVTVGQATAPTLPSGPGRPTRTYAAAAPDPQSPRLTGAAAHDR